MSHLHGVDIQKPIGEYKRFNVRKYIILLTLIILLIFAFIYYLGMGSVNISFSDIFNILLNGEGTHKDKLIIMGIRLPQLIAALFAGAGLAVAGAVMQAALNNPLGSPFTLGISQAAAFGAALAVIFFGSGVVHSSSAIGIHLTNYYLTTLSAFLFCLLEVAVVLFIAKLKHNSPEVMILGGVALGALFSAGTMLLQYFADDIELASMVFWTFGDISRAGWDEAIFIAVSVSAALLFFFTQGWNYNTLSLGDESAKSLGVSVVKVRIFGVVISVFITAVIISLLGIIGFIGLICPHILRKRLGGDYRFLIPASALCGGVLLITADIFSKVILSPHILPVSIITAFVGAPIFVWLIAGGDRNG